MHTKYKLNVLIEEKFNKDSKGNKKSTHKRHTFKKMDVLDSKESI